MARISELRDSVAWKRVELQHLKKMERLSSILDSDVCLFRYVILTFSWIDELKLKSDMLLLIAKYCQFDDVEIFSHQYNLFLLWMCCEFQICALSLMFISFYASPMNTVPFRTLT